MIDEKEVELLYQNIQHKLIYSLRKRGAGNYAEDIAQEAWLNAWHYRTLFRGECSLEKWVWVIARYALIDAYRKRLPDLVMPRSFSSFSEEYSQLWAVQESNFAREISAKLDIKKILKRCKPKTAAILQHCLTDRKAMSTKERLQLMRARREARKIACQKQ